MPLGLPESSTIVEDRIKIDVAREAPDSNPYVRNHWLLALIIGFGRRIFDFYSDLQRSINQVFPDTATGTFAERWGAIWGKTRLAATQAVGNFAATGTATTLIPSGTSYNSGGNVYTSTDDATIQAVSSSVLSITRSGTTATVTMVSDHGIASNVPVTVSGANETDYNVTDAAIIVTGLDTFTYQVSGSPSTPATGTILAGYTSASVPVTSDGFGADQNLSADSLGSLQSPIAGVDNDARVDFGEVAGGSDQESDDDLKERYLERIRNPVAHFNDTDIIDQAKTVNGVTRVWVEGAGDALTGSISVTSITRTGNVATVTTGAVHGFDSGMQAVIAGAVETDYNGTFPIIVESTTIFHYVVENTPSTPATGTITTVGQVALGTTNIYFTRDNDDVSQIPSGAEVATVAAAVAEIRPANSSSLDITVAAPVAVPQNFVFTDLSPNTAAMRSAITANLTQFFKESTVVSQDVDQDAYRSAIFNSIDENTGQGVQTFTLSDPSADISVDSGELGTLGNITYP